MYVEEINNILRPNISEKEVVIDLFAGCGGLSLGFESAGFETLGYECVTTAAKTYTNNLHGDCINDMLRVDYNYPHADIIIGGPPCQPFSVRGNKKVLMMTEMAFLFSLML